MEKQQSRFLSLSYLILAIGVGLGAFGAHGLKSHVGPELLANWHTATLYLFIHALALDLLSLNDCKNSAIKWAMRLYIGGIILFSGNLYLYVLSGQKIFAMIVPIGGVMFILGHLLAFLGIRNKPAET